jgi:FecR protein
MTGSMTRSITRSLRWTTAVLLVAVVPAMQGGTCFAEATRIGVASSIKPNADGVVAGSSQTLAAGSELYANETIRTGNLGQADLVFLDHTNLTVGPTSEVLLDKFVYDPTGSKGKVVFKATRGAFRFVTGTQDHRAYSVETPFGTLGVRGTKVEVVVTPPSKRKQEPGECTTKVRLIEGQASFTTSAGKLARLTEPNQTVCISQSGVVTYGSSSTSILGFQLASEQQSPPPSTPTPPPAGPGNPGGPPITPPCTTHCQP